jgi:HlyD family secretion protein
MKLLGSKALVTVLVLAASGASIAWVMTRTEAQGSVFQAASVERGDLVVSIRATGTVEPEESINVGAQVGGQILFFGKDAAGGTVDYGSEVEQGTILAQIDDSLYAAEVAQMEAQVAQAEAGAQSGQATLDQLKAELRKAERDWNRAQKIGAGDALAQATYDGYQSAYEAAVANVAAGEASIRQSMASLAQARASLQSAQRNMGYCTIKSPVKGVIIDRRVNVGQTVNASMDAPSLFLIAKDLKHMQVWAAVNEADIGKIKPGLPVAFTVDAFPGETFQGTVRKVRLNASMTQNVVTYMVEITADNSSGRLLPYLTANVQFETARHEDVLQLPNSALRWTPTAEQAAPGSADALAGLNAQEGSGIVWVADGAYVRPIAVHVGLTDDVNSEVDGQGLAEGMEVVTGIGTQTAGQDGATNPFMPKPPKGSKMGPPPGL